MPASEATEATQDAELRDQLAKAIRAAVQLRIGPNAREVIERGGSMPLTPAEAQDAADAALAVFDEVALERMADRLLADTLLKSMDFRNGAAMDLVPAQELAAIWVGAARAMLADAPNYSETPWEFEVGLAAEPGADRMPERYVLIVQRVGKLTPHEGRRQAEQRAARAEATVSRVRKLHREHMKEHLYRLPECAACDLETALAEPTGESDA